MVAMAVEIFGQPKTVDAADAVLKAYGVAATMKALEGVDSKVLQALASVGMQPDQLVALAFQGLAERADKIGQLNISPDLLRELLTHKSNK